MDHVELRILADELYADTAVALAAEREAAARFSDRQRVSDESCAFHLTRLYNVVEQMALRVAKAFENNVDDEKGWHIGLIRRLSIRIQGIRPALFPAELRQPLHELRSFRHVFVHAYDLELDPEKLALVLKYARQVAEPLPKLIAAFVQEVAREQSIELGPLP